MSNDLEHRACFDLPAPGGIIETHYYNEFMHHGNTNEFFVLPSKPFLIHPPETEWPFTHMGLNKPLSEEEKNQIREAINNLEKELDLTLPR